jgi:hypothetical protein
LYGLPNFLHFAQRLICISPQFGHRNFVASPPGAIGLPQLVHVININVAGFSVMVNFLGVGLVIVALPYKSFEVQQDSLTIISSSLGRPCSCFYACLFGLYAQDYYRVFKLLMNEVSFWALTCATLFRSGLSSLRS